MNHSSIQAQIDFQIFDVLQTLFRFIIHPTINDLFVRHQLCCHLCAAKTFDKQNGRDDAPAAPNRCQ